MLGLETVVGVDGPYVQRGHLMISQQFALMLSMEVGERLPDAASRTPAGTACTAILFSATISRYGPGRRSAMLCRRFHTH